MVRTQWALSLCGGIGRRVWLKLVSSLGVGSSPTTSIAMHFTAQQGAFCRKSLIFNKGRFSRTRQLVRAIFFFSLLLNVAVIFGILMTYYLYTVNLASIWWSFYLLLMSFFFGATLRRTPLKLSFANVGTQILKFNILNFFYKNRIVDKIKQVSAFYKLYLI